jgi:hypothetical protein
MIESEIMIAMISPRKRVLRLRFMLAIIDDSTNKKWSEYQKIDFTSNKNNKNFVFGFN